MKAGSSHDMHSRPDYTRDELVQGFDRLLKSGQDADMIVVCGGAKLKCHSAIICPRSEFFLKEYLKNPRESSIKTIELREDSLPIVRRLIRYFYVLDYDDIPGPDMPKGYPPVKFNARMFAVAVKLDISGLQKIAASKFEDCCIRLAGPCRDALRALGDLADIAGMIYTSNPQTYKELKKSVATTVGSHLANDHRLLETPDVKEMCLQSSDLAYDVMIEGIKAATGKVS
ncbi:MAG: hypothetical protein Q9218_002187 [Villophora microphyllina]